MYRVGEVLKILRSGTNAVDTEKKSEPEPFSGRISFALETNRKGQRQRNVDLPAIPGVLLRFRCSLGDIRIHTIGL